MSAADYAAIIKEYSDKQLVEMAASNAEALAAAREMEQAIKAEAMSRMERNGGKVLGSPNGPRIVLTAGPNKYDPARLRGVQNDIPPDVWAQVLKSSTEVVESVDGRKVGTLIKQYGPDSTLGRALSACVVPGNPTIKYEGGANG